TRAISTPSSRNASNTLAPKYREPTIVHLMASFLSWIVGRRDPADRSARIRDRPKDILPAAVTARRRKLRRAPRRTRRGFPQRTDRSPCPLLAQRASRNRRTPRA